MSQTQPEVRVLMEDIFGSDSEGEEEHQELKEIRKPQEKEDGEIENSSDDDSGKPKNISSKSKGVSFEDSKSNGIFGSDDESQGRASDDSGEALSPKRKIQKGSKSRVSLAKKDTDLVDSDAEEEVHARKKPKFSRKRVRPGEKEGADAGKERVRNRIKRGSGTKRKEKGTKSSRLTSNGTCSNMLFFFIIKSDPYLFNRGRWRRRRW